MINNLHFESTDEILFESDLLPTPESFEDLRAGHSEGELSTILGKITGAKCTIRLGKPICVYLNNFYQMKGLELPNKFNHLSGDFSAYKFFVVRFACSFVAVKNCQIEEARFDVHLLGDNVDEPIALDLFPSRIVTQRPKKKVTTKVGASLKFFETGVDGQYVSEFEHEGYDPEIFSYGVQTSQFRWKFKKTTQNPIEGDRVLFAIIGKPQNSRVNAQFRVSAEVHTTAFRRLVLDTRNDEVARASYTLL